jgi:hypothetical protein
MYKQVIDLTWLNDDERKDLDQKMWAYWSDLFHAGWKIPSRLQQALQEDDSYGGDEDLVEFYNALSPHERGIVNEVVMKLCGWSLLTLAKGDESWQEGVAHEEV